jgi:hypothetical protein
VVDGGFLQVMVATRGRTGMEGAVLRDFGRGGERRGDGERGGDWNRVDGTGSCGLSEETLRMKVRYGELVSVRERDDDGDRDGDGDGDGDGDRDGGGEKGMRIRTRESVGGLIAFGTVEETEPLTRRRRGDASLLS